MEALEVAHDLSAVEDGIADLVGICAEVIARGPTGGGEDRGGETGGVFFREDRHGLAALQAFPLPQDRPTAGGVCFQMPGTGDVGLGGGHRLVALGQELQILSGEGVGGIIERGAHRTSLLCVPRARLSSSSFGPALFDRGWIRSSGPGCCSKTREILGENWA